MVKNEKTSLGRALVKHHNHMVQQSKDKNRAYWNQHKMVLESVTEITDLDAIIERAEEAERAFMFDHPTPTIAINLDPLSHSSDMPPEQKKVQQKEEEALHANDLCIPRRPPWNVEMSIEVLDANERQAFLTWRRNLARLEENEKLVLTPFEKNLDIWRQLWRVVERSDLLVMVVDARDPLFYRCPDLEVYAQEIDKHKKTMLLVNKADLLPFSVREKWAQYFHANDILYLFWSAKAAIAILELKDLGPSGDFQSMHEDNDVDTNIYGREELLELLQSEAEEIATMRKSSPSNSDFCNSRSKSVIVGFVGYPNVGKSSTINALVGEKRTGVTCTPGKTKHFQTLIISEELTLCDCPGLVFPSFSSSRYSMIACGVLPIHRMTEHREAVQVVANTVKRHELERAYNISLPKPKTYELQSRAPFASELLRVYCASRGYVSSSGLPDETKASRQILKDYIDGKLPHFELPPGIADVADLTSPSSFTIHGEDISSSDSEVKKSGPILEDVLNDLMSFDIENGVNSGQANKVKKKQQKGAHKRHKKPQRKKDRGWRVRNDGTDGMPIVRAFQKPASTAP